MSGPESGYRQVEGAWVHPHARLGKDVALSPGAVVGAQVEVGDRTWIGPGAVIYGPTTLGAENRVFPGAVLGGEPQDVGYRGEPTRLVIGDRNVFRESVTVSRASTKGEGVTRIGSDNYFMAGSHIGHDTVVEDHVVLANAVLIAGHCRIGSHVNMAGGSAIVQFTTVGRFAFVGGLSGGTTDLEPFCAHDGFHCRPKGINSVGLSRGGISPQVLRCLKEAFRVIFAESGSVRGGDLEAARREIESRGALCEEVVELLEFMGRSREGRFHRQLQPLAR